MFPRYVPATDFGHIWEHLKTYALLATWVEKYVAFVLPETKAKISLKFTTLNIWICGLLMRLFSCIFPM